MTSRTSCWCLLILLTVVVAGTQAIAQEPPIRVGVKTVDVEDIGRISDGKCPASRPCAGLKREASLHIELTEPGYALAFLQSEGKFYNQEGRLLVNNLLQGDVRLYPGIGPDVEGVFPLYIVVSDSKLDATPDDEGLEYLPAGSVSQWGPVYLSTSISSRLIPQFFRGNLIIFVVAIFVVFVAGFLVGHAYGEGRGIEFWKVLRLGPRPSAPLPNESGGAASSGKGSVVKSKDA